MHRSAKWESPRGARKACLHLSQAKSVLSSARKAETHRLTSCGGPESRAQRSGRPSIGLPGAENPYFAPLGNSGKPVYFPKIG